MDRPSWIVFDVGDVLLNWQKSATMLSLRLGVERDELLSSLFKYADAMLLGTLTAADGWTKVITDLGIKANPEALVREWRSKDCWFQEPLNLITALHADGYRLAIMANSWLGLSHVSDRGVVPAELELFDYIFESAEYGTKKPDSAFYELVERGLGTNSADIFLVDDGLANVTVAAGRGWQSFRFLAAHNSAANATAALSKKLIDQ